MVARHWRRNRSQGVAVGAGQVGVFRYRRIETSLSEERARLQMVDWVNAACWAEKLDKEGY